ncbi:unnamed protein product [Anisakis simplex]|uniref:DNA polymerase alpha subunit B n=1 Tax=Anisakis simplex TaxID=6269 RepID=A0A0M3JYK0_ANISI|nr:unnamed protein product [Anisakis simplex]
MYVFEEPFYICGQVLDESDEKQESGGWFIRSDDEEDMSMVNIDLSHLHQFSLFSGKIVAMKGTNKDGSLFVPSEIFEPAKMQLSSIVNKSVVDQLSIWCACGPFTSNDTLSYEQLYDLLSLVKQQKPNILILMGPFVDRSSKAVLSPQFNMKFYDLFENLLLKISAMMEDTSTKLVLIPSFKKDATVLPIFPCASFDVRPECKKILSKNITFARDPSQLRINGVNVAITNSEIIQTLSRFEVYKSETQDEHRMQRIISHLFSQRSLYPLYPAPSDTAQRIDETIRECSLSCIPHIMIMPSMLSPMIQVIDGCLCINPGILVRGSSGTFMEMNIDMKMIQSAETDQHNCSIADYCEIKILRI